MEGEKKRKRVEIGEIHGGSGRRKRERENEAVAPTDEEVDEFFAILRRMHVAVKYFERSNFNGNGGRRLTERLGTPLDSEVVSRDDNEDDVKVTEKGVNGVRGNVVLDLNTVPEGETSSA